MVSIERFFWFFVFSMPFPPSFCSGTSFSVSVEKGKVGDGWWRLHFVIPTKTHTVAFCLYFLLYKTPPSLGGIASQNEKGGSFFLYWWHHAFPIYLSGLDRDGNEGLIDGNGCFWEFLSSLLHVCVREWEDCVGEVCVQVRMCVRRRCRQKHTVSVATTAKQIFKHTWYHLH